jgi:predicted  nucleic acid-binding Zn-ribbon protein
MSRTIRINLSADATNFSENIRRASRSIASLGSDLNGSLGRIRTQTSLLIATLGNSADGMRKMGIQSQGLTKQLDLQDKYTRRLEADLAKMNPTTAAAGIAFVKLEGRILQSALKSQNLTNSINALKTSMANLRSGEGLATLAHQMENARIATQQLVVGLGHEATAAERDRAALQGLNAELTLSIRNREKLRAAAQTSSDTRGPNAPETRSLITQGNAAALATGMLISRIAQTQQAVRMAPSLERVDTASSRMASSGLDTRMGVARLGVSPEPLELYRTKLAGLAQELVDSTAKEYALERAVAKANTTYRAGSEEIAKLKAQHRQQQVANQEMQNRGQRLRDLITAQPSLDAAGGTQAALDSVRARLNNLRAGFSSGASGAEQFRASQTLLRHEMSALENHIVHVKDALSASRRAHGPAATETNELRNRVRGLNAELIALRRNYRDSAEAATIYSRVSAAIQSPQMLSAGIGTTAALTYPIGRMLSEGMKYNSMMESQTTAFTTMIGSAKEAKSLMLDLQNMAMVTPFETLDLTTQATTLVQYGSSVRNTLPLLKTLGDLSLGNKEKFQVIAYNFAQALSLGRLQAIDARSMTLAGFNPITAISDMRKKKGQKDFSVNDIQKQMEDGKISIKELVAAMEMATSSGGRFYKALENASKTYEGRLSTLRDNLKIMLGALTKPLFDWLAESVFPALIWLTTWVKNFAIVNPVFTKIVLGITLVAAAIGPLLVTVYALNKAWGIVAQGWGLVAEGAKAAWRWMTSAGTAGLVAGLKNIAIMSAWILGALALVVVAKTIHNNWKELGDWFRKFGTLMGNVFDIVANEAVNAFLKARLAVSDFFDKSWAYVKAAAKGDLFVEGGIDMHYTQSDTSKALTDAISKNDSLISGILKAYDKSKLDLSKSSTELWASVKEKFLDDFQAIKNWLPDFSIPVIDPKLDFGKINYGDLTDSTKSEEDEKAKAALEKLVETLKDIVSKVKDQAKQFRDALGLFEKAIVEKLSPEKILIRLRSQVRVMEKWSASMASLKDRLGEDSPFFKAVLAAGPTSPGYAGLSAMTDTQLKESENYYNQKGNLAIGPAGLLTRLNYKDEAQVTRMATNLTVNIVGGVVVGNEAALVDIITKEFKRQGF